MHLQFRFIQNQLMLKQYFLLALLFFTALAFSNAQNGIGLREGVIIDTENQLIYFQTVDRQVQALSLDQGQVLWTTNHQAKPLSLAQNQLICLSGASTNSNQMELISFDASKSGEQANRIDYQLPEGIKVNLGQTLNDAFSITSYYQNGQLYFSWQYEQIVRRGIFESEENESPRLRQGAFQISSNNTPRAILNEELPSSFAGKSIIPTQATRIPGQSGFQFLSKDENHVLVSTKDADDANFNAYRWELYRADSKEKIGEIRDYRSYAPFYITPSNVLIYEVGPHTRTVNGEIVETPLQLLAIDLASGRELWVTPIFDPIYRGPTPP